MEISTVVSFRLSGDYVDELKRRASKQGISIGDLARRMIISGLTDGSEDERRNQLAEILDQVRRQREESLRLANVLLVNVAGVNEEAAWEYLQSIMSASAKSTATDA